MTLIRQCGCDNAKLFKLCYDNKLFLFFSDGNFYQLFKIVRLNLKKNCSDQLLKKFNKKGTIP